MPDYYEIKIKGHLDLRWVDWFASLKQTHLEGDETLISGLLERIRDLDLTLVSVNCSTPSTHQADKNNKE